MSLQIAIQGQAGSFHHGVAEQYFTQPHEVLFEETFAGTFRALEEGRADYIVTAIENTLYGNLADVFDLLLEHEVQIVGEYTEHISQQLIAHENISLTDITEVMSHPAALDQCREWLEVNIPHAVITEHHDTAGAVRNIKQHKRYTTAAIAGRTAAALYDMPILAEDIEDEKDNFTRFFIISKTTPADTSSHNKSSLLLTTSHESGALYQALGVFHQLHLNLTKLESRPLRGQAFRYQFFIDVEMTPPQLHKAIKQLRANGCEVRLLGTYRASSMPQA